MIAIRIEDKTKALSRLAASLSSRNMTVANVRSINVAIQKANTQYRLLIVGEYNLKYADTKTFAVASRATYSNPQGSISGLLTPISLARFNPTFYNTKTGKVFTIKKNKEKESNRALVQSSRAETANDVGKSTVSFSVKKGQERQLPFAFMIQSDKNAGWVQQIWARCEYKGNRFDIGKARNPISPLKTVSPFGAMTNPDISKAAEKDTHQKYVR